MDRWKQISLYNNEPKFGDLLNRVEKSYKGKEKVHIRIVSWWLRCEVSTVFYPKKQTSYYRKLWHRVAEILGLEHITVQFSLDKYYCVQHKKYCKYIKNLEEGQLYDSDYECSDSEYDDCCNVEHRIVTKRHIFIIAPGENYDEITLKQYLSHEMGIHCI